MSQPPLDPQNPYGAPQSQPQANYGHGQGDGTGGVIPYKNPYALIGYYLSIFGLFPCLGIFVSIPAVVCGIIGLQKRKANPVIKGSAHAWIAIILGGVMTLLNLLGFLVLFGSALFG